METYKAIKIPLKNVVKDLNVITILTGSVVNSHRIFIHALLFMKLFLLKSYEEKQPLPKIDRKFVRLCMNVHCNRDKKGNTSDTSLEEFYQNEYRHLSISSFSDKERSRIKEIEKTLSNIKGINLNFYKKENLQNIAKSLNLKTSGNKPELIDRIKIAASNPNKIKNAIKPINSLVLGTVLDYLADGIVTMYENNIKLHYVEYVARYVNCQLKEIETDKWELKKIKNDILDNTLSSDPKHHQWIKDIKRLITPNRKYLKDNLSYDLKVSPQDYLPCMIKMMKDLENKGLKIKNVFPMRTQLTPGHIRIDTTSLIKLLVTENKTEKLKNVASNHGEWKNFFKLEEKCFKKRGYIFHNMIETDGISCSILLSKIESDGNKEKKVKVEQSEKYIDELEDYSQLKNKKIVGIDPGKSDLIYCIDGDTKDATKFRYTQNSRRKECKIKRHSQIIEGFKQEKVTRTEDNGNKITKTVKDWETDLSRSSHNHKTLDFGKFKEYIKAKNDMNSMLFEFYERYIFRKLKLSRYVNIKRHEQKMITNFKKKYGNPEDVVIAFGDFEQKSHMKWIEPTKGKGFRTLFRRNGYETFLVDEFRTSCKCLKCEGGSCEKFLMRDNPKPEKKGVEKRVVKKLVHGVLRCKNCNTVWNRDVNGAGNIYRIAKCAINGKERPKYLCRDKKKEESSKLTLNITESPKRSIEEVINPEPSKRLTLKIILKPLKINTGAELISRTCVKRTDTTV